MDKSPKPDQTDDTDETSVRCSASKADISKDHVDVPKEFSSVHRLANVVL